MHFLKQIVFWLKHLEVCSIHNKVILRSGNGSVPSFVQVMAWCQTGDKSLAEPMLIQQNVAYARVSNSYDQPQLPPTKMAPAENGESKQSRISSTSSNTNWHNHVLIQGSR